MGSLTGVGDVDFDCKTATIWMKGAATLEKETVEKALTGAGCKMGEFTTGARPTFAVVSVKLKRFDATGASGATLEQELPHELPVVTELFVEADGRATLLVREGASLDEAALTTALAKRQLATESFASKRWPTSAAHKVAVVKAESKPLGGVADLEKARTAIEGISNVLAAIARRDGSSFVVFTREPCANLEARLQEVLRAAGLELARVE